MSMSNAASGFWGNRSRVSWGAILAGVVTALATTVLLSLLGAALGAGSIHPLDATATDLSNYGTGAAIWQILNLALSMLFGGYVTSRLSGTHSHLDGELHGVTMWGLATLLGSLLLAHALSGLLGWVAPAATSAVSRAVGTDAVAGVASDILPAAQIDRMAQSLFNSGDPTTMTREQINAEISSLVHSDLPGGLSDANRARLVSLVAADSGVTRDEALRRVTRMENDARVELAQAEQKARVAADAVARNTATAARALFTALTVGLLSSLIGAWLGTRHKRHLHPVVHHDYHPVEHTYHPVQPTYHPVEHTTYHPVNTVHEPAYTRSTYEPSSVSVYDDSGNIVSQYLRGVTFPVNKQDLLRLARSRNAGSSLVRSIEQMADGTYANTDEVLRALGKLTA